MKKMLSDAQIKMVRDAFENVKGTDHFIDYTMQLESKWKRGWLFVGWYPLMTPAINTKVYVKHNPTGDYIYIEYQNGSIDRYLINDRVKKLLDL